MKYNMNYHESMDYLKSLWKFGSQLGLDRVKALLRLMGNPHKEIKHIHIAGTNGKGSSAAMLHSVLRRGGYKVGLYTSPYLERFTERIKIQGEEISTDDVARLLNFTRPFVDKLVEEGFDHPTEFELITAIALYYFKEQDVDLSIMEVGLGGRLDATNVINPLVSLITPVGMDHKERLGNTLGEIAFEKAGIIKKHVPVIVSCQKPDALEVILKVAKAQESPAYVLNRDFFFSGNKDNLSFRGRRINIENIKISLMGKHQLINSAAVLATLEVLNELGYPIPEEAIKKGFANVHWPGRMELLSKEPTILIDGAHNKEGFLALIESIKEHFPDKKVVFGVGILKDKGPEDIIPLISDIAERIVTFTPESDRAILANELANKFKNHLPKKDIVAADNIEEGVIRILKGLKNNEMAVFCGSLYLIGRIRKLLFSGLNQ